MSGENLRILIVDDDAAMRAVLEIRLQQWGYDVRTAADGDEARGIAESASPDLVLTDLVMPGLSGLELLRVLRAGEADRPVILMTAHGSIDLAVEAMKHGARDFVTKPLDYAKLHSILESARRDLALRRENLRLDAKLEKGRILGQLIGESRAMRELCALLMSVGSTDASVILTGESGTGKELAARAIHDISSRSRHPFVAINAAAIPESLMEAEIFGHERGAFTGAVGVRAGCFELAHRGTLLLDEIAEMPPALQPKLLRVLEGKRVRRIGGGQEIPVDVRVVAATNRDPRAAVAEGRLREDLYYRLNVFTVVLPPLRERRSDIPLLVRHFVREFDRKHSALVEGVHPEAMEILHRYAWPGNVRELRNVIERAVIMAKERWIETPHLPPYVRETQGAGGVEGAPAAGMTAAEAEKQLILRTLESTGNNKAETARRLGLDVKTIRNKLRSYGLG